MKKQVVITALAGALILGGGGFAYYSYAAGIDQGTKIPIVENSLSVEQNNEATLDSSSLDRQTNESLESTIGPGDLEPGTIDISDVPVEDVHIPLAENKVSLQSQGLTQNWVAAMQQEYGLHIRAFYTSPEGTEILLSQVDATEVKPVVIEGLKKTYSRETVELTEINGLTTLYVDGETRKVVHLISDDHFFTIQTPNGTIDQLMTIANQIHE
ncbi:DUF4367 domain-containing protein [Paenibacillus lautus]|uniref:DUF4367 domain-containing protein n=1 Tax=Paenibacillus lautus TaxID=1401 RepID=UPI003D28D313